MDMEQVTIPLSIPGETLPALSESGPDSETLPVQSQPGSDPGREHPAKEEKVLNDNGSRFPAEHEKTETPELSQISIPAGEKESIELETEFARIEFTTSRTSGCAPLAVEFINSSENAYKYQWNFGDGGSSVEENPSYIFDESGEYKVVLRMTGKNGLEYLQQQNIRVFETPTALFEVEENVNLSGPVYFYNYSKSAQFYEWDFGDLEKSSFTDPVHYYEQPGSYHVKLKVWTENQCFDSLVIYNTFKSESNDIHFPNAFTPNLNGPSGGYYNGKKRP